MANPQPPKGVSAPPNSIFTDGPATPSGNAPKWWQDLNDQQRDEATNALRSAGIDVNQILHQDGAQRLVLGAITRVVQPATPRDMVSYEDAQQAQPVDARTYQQAAVGPAGNYMEQVISIAESAGIPWQILYSVVKYETHGTWDPGQEGGLAGINTAAHPEVGDKAMDPSFALHWAAAQLRTLYSKYNNWGLAVYGYQDGTAMADSIMTGRPQPGALQNAQKVVFGVLGQSGEVMGLDVKKDLTDFGMASQSMTSGGRVIGLPDPADVKAKAKDFFKSMFLANPTDEQLNAAVDFANYYTTASQTGQYNATRGAAGSSAFNPFQRGTSAQGASPGIVSPVPLQPDGTPYPITQDYHGDEGGHPGTDIGVPEGTPISAPVSGTVEFMDEGNGSYGLSARIVGDDGKYYIMGHLSKQNLALEGQHVAPGTQLGLSGSTGESTGPHLHFEVRDSKVGKTLNSEQILQGASPTSAAGVGASAAGGQAGDRSYTQYDWQQRMYDQYSQSDAYKQLYGNKPAYLPDTPAGDQTYQNEFVSAGRSPFVGNGGEYRRFEPDAQAIQQGMITGDPDVTRQYEEGTPQALQAVPFRERLASAASLVNRLL